MKKLLSTIILACIASSSIYADANYLVRKNCYYAASWRHKTHANVSKKGSAAHYFADGSGDNNSCSPTRTDKFGYFAATTSTASMVAEARAVTTSGRYTVVHINYGLSSIFNAGGNTDMIQPEYSYAPMYEDPNPPAPPIPGMQGLNSNVNTDIINFDELSHSVVLNNININIGVDDPDMVNSYSTFKIWILDATGVEDEANAAVITTMQGFIHNGQLILLGDLSQSEFTKQNNKAIYTANSLNKTFLIPANINLDDVIVKVGSDAGNLGQGVNPDYAIDLNAPKFAQNAIDAHESSKLTLDILGNPSSNNLNFIVADGTIEYSAARVTLIDNSGKMVKELYSGSISKSNKEFGFDITSLPVGNYYLTVTTNTNEKFTRKFIKQ